MPDTVILDEIRRDGSGDGGCQAGRRIYWRKRGFGASQVDQSAAFTLDERFERLRDPAMRTLDTESPRRAARPTSTVVRQRNFSARPRPSVGGTRDRSGVRSHRNVSLCIVRVISHLVVDETGPTHGSVFCRFRPRNATPGGECLRGFAWRLCRVVFLRECRDAWPMLQVVAVL